MFCLQPFNFCQVREAQSLSLLYTWSTNKFHFGNQINCAGNNVIIVTLWHEIFAGWQFFVLWELIVAIRTVVFLVGD